MMISHGILQVFGQIPAFAQHPANFLMRHTVKLLFRLVEELIFNACLAYDNEEFIIEILAEKNLADIVDESCDKAFFSLAAADEFCEGL